MRYSRMDQDNAYKKTSGTGNKGAIAIVIIIAVVAVVYLIGAAKVGGFISDKVITPVIAYFTGEDTVNNKQNDAQESSLSSADNAAYEQSTAPALPMKREVSFEENPSYFLQIGVFEDRNNAATLADEMKIKGCAGYIYNDSEKYRVFISGYSNKNDAENVQQRILTDYEMDTKIYELSNTSTKVSVETEENVLAAIEEASQDMLLYLKNAISISQKFDKQELEKEDVLKEIENLYNLASAKKNTFYEYSQRTDNSLIAAVYKYYDSICTIFAFSDSDKSDTELSADVKSAYIASCIAYSDFLGSLQ